MGRRQRARGLVRPAARSVWLIVGIALGILTFVAPILVSRGAEVGGRPTVGVVGGAINAAIWVAAYMLLFLICDRIVVIRHQKSQISGTNMNFGGPRSTRSWGRDYLIMAPSLPETARLLTTNGYPERSAWWIMDQVESEGLASGIELGQGDRALLMSSVRSLTSLHPQWQQEFSRRMVWLIRNSIMRTKSTGAQTSQLASDLSVPYWWRVHFEVLAKSHCTLIIAVLTRKAIFGDPMLGEHSPWTSV